MVIGGLILNDDALVSPPPFLIYVYYLFHVSYGYEKFSSGPQHSCTINNMAGCEKIPFGLEGKRTRQTKIYKEMVCRVRLTSTFIQSIQIVNEKMRQYNSDAKFCAR